jgi:hypothetical protein
MQARMAAQHLGVEHIGCTADGRFTDGKACVIEGGRIQPPVRRPSVQVTRDSAPPQRSG